MGTLPGRGPLLVDLVSARARPGAGQRHSLSPRIGLRLAHEITHRAARRLASGPGRDHRRSTVRDPGSLDLLEKALREMRLPRTAPAGPSAHSRLNPGLPVFTLPAQLSFDDLTA